MSKNVPDPFVNLSVPELLEHALKLGEGVFSRNGAFTTRTGTRTGRSTKDRFIVEDAETKNAVDWGKVNQPCSPEAFANLWARAESHISSKGRYLSEWCVGANPDCTVPVTVITERAWHHVFARNLFISNQDISQSRLKNEGWTLLNVPTLKTDPARDKSHSDACLMINFTERKILLCGLEFAGEMKKAMFSVLNYLYPALDILPMHCAANIGQTGDVALFFGLSGTGKTTLSADPNRHLIGDDEHGWHVGGVFNFEGGCYAKCIDLCREREPVIWDAIKFGSIMENVVLDSETRAPRYEDATLTQNTRAAYPRSHLAGCVKENAGALPSAVIFLTCDLYGVLPPVSLLTEEQAAYHFLSGYTALLGGTEVGSDAIQPTFSACFGAPFLPRAASVYAKLLIKRIRESGAQVYLVNTGWTEGAFGTGRRFSIPETRTVINAVLSGELKQTETETISCFHLEVPKRLLGIHTALLNPMTAWADEQLYSNAEKQLAQKFADNFKRFDVQESILNAGPVLEGVF